MIKLPEGVDVGDVSDGYHTFNELYEFRKVYNAALFNEWAAQGKYCVHKSKGQISNHYELNDWDLFQIPEHEKALFEFDGHTAKDVLERLKALPQIIDKV